MITTIEEGIKFWHDILGMNTIPADTRNKKPLEEWKRWQTEGTPDPLQLHWEINGKFANGINIVLGKIHNSVGLKDYYLACIDLDSDSAIREFCNWNGKQLTLEELGKYGFLVEQHADDKTRAHVFLVTKERLKKKDASVGKHDLRIEVKTDSLVSVTPSYHKNGSRYQFIGDYRKFVDDPIFHNKETIEQHINEICKKYGIEYLNGDATNTSYNSTTRNKEPIRVGERHDKLLSYANSLIARLNKTTNKDTIYDYLVVYNNNPNEVKQPLPEAELKQIFNDSWNNIVNINTYSKQEQQENTTEKVLSVLEAKRTNQGSITVLGTIVSVSEMYKLEIENNNQSAPEFTDAKLIQLEDTEKMDENERLDVVLYDDMVVGVIAGEVVKVTGNVRIENKKGNKNKMKKIVLHATNIEYVNKKEVVITEKDIEGFHKFVRLPNLLQRLTSMFAPNVIGHDVPKIGLLRTVVGGVNRGKISSGRIDTFLVGDPGTAKTTLTKECTEAKLGSRYVSAPHATTKTITAIVDRDNEVGTVLRVGAIPLASGNIVGINEITSFVIEEQGRLLDVMSEGKIQLDKQGQRFTILAATTIVATANPIQTKWSDPDKISNDEIMIRKSLLDRFTQIYSFRDNMDEKQTKEFIKIMDKIRKRKEHNYNFLRKYLLYASGIDVKISKDAEKMLGEFWAEAKCKGLLSIRMYFGLYEIAEAQSRLQLKDTVDEEIATQAMEAVQIITTQYGETIKMILSPKEVSYELFLNILQNLDSGISIEELCKIACKQNEQVSDYLGNNWSTDKNHKLRAVIDMLSNHSNVKRIGQKPIVLKWLFDASDVSDANSNNIASDKPTEDNNNSETTSAWSPRNSENNSETTSDRSDRSDREKEYPSTCYYCDEYFDGIGKQGYENHVITKHPKKPCYPGIADLEVYGLKPQGMSWEH